MFRACEVHSYPNYSLLGHQVMNDVRVDDRVHSVRTSDAVDFFDDVVAGLREQCLLGVQERALLE
jgi:hypothetical protein